MTARYVTPGSSTAFALTTAFKTLALVIPGATLPVTIIEIGVSVDAGAGRFTVDLFESTQAGAGTAGASTGAKQTGGFVAGDTTGPLATYGVRYTAEPTVVTSLKTWIVPAPGPLVIQFPLGREPESLVSGATKYKALGLRVLIDSGTPNAYGYIEWQE